MRFYDVFVHAVVINCLPAGLCYKIKSAMSVLSSLLVKTTLAAPLLETCHCTCSPTVMTFWHTNPFLVRVCHWQFYSVIIKEGLSSVRLWWNSILFDTSHIYLIAECIKQQAVRKSVLAQNVSKKKRHIHMCEPVLLAFTVLWTFARKHRKGWCVVKHCR